MNTRLGGAVLTMTMLIGVAFPTVEQALNPDAPPMTYDDAVDECSWISAADNIPCLVLPDGDGWKAVGAVATFEDGSMRLEDGTSYCDPTAYCATGVRTGETFEGETGWTFEDEPAPAVPVVAAPGYTG